jgi:glycosyltransferase A (GT-A) superfamily protein (DUF2064 family)
VAALTPTPNGTSRCVLLFARAAGAEAHAKGIGRGAALFALARRRVLAAAAALGVDLVVVGPQGDAPGVRRLPQRGEGFAERLGNAFADARALGYGEIVAVPTDVPGLGARHLAAAFDRLGTEEVVLGPSPDGGVYLLGIGTGIDPAALLGGVRWRTSRVFADLVAGASGAAGVLESLGDVDRRSDLPALAARAVAAADPELARLVASLLGGPARFAPAQSRPGRGALLACQISPRAPPAALPRAA